MGTWAAQLQLASTWVGPPKLACSLFPSTIILRSHTMEAEERRKGQRQQQQQQQEDERDDAERELEAFRCVRAGSLTLPFHLPSLPVPRLTRSLDFLGPRSCRLPHRERWRTELQQQRQQQPQHQSDTDDVRKKNLEQPAGGTTHAMDHDDTGKSGSATIQADAVRPVAAPSPSTAKADPVSPRRAGTNSKAPTAKSPKSPSGPGGTTHGRLDSSLASSLPSSSHASTSSNAQLTPVQLYGEAVVAERQGRLNDALRAYRAAFRKDENVDKKYHAASQAQLARQGGPLDKDKSTVNPLLPTTGGDSIVDELGFTFERTLQFEPDYDRFKSKISRSSTTSYISRLIDQFRENPYAPVGEEKPPPLRPDEPLHLTFIPKNVNRPVHLNKLPDEILLHILSILTRPSPNAKYPDVRSLERGFALTCRKARILSLEASATVWRNMCLTVYRPPLQLPAAPQRGDDEHKHDYTSVETGRASSSRPPGVSKRNQVCELLASRLYSLDWRLMWIEQPRIRTDGCYISQITYIRKGAQDGSSYYDPTHVVTYYRYLVFKPNGDVVSLLSHDIPSHVVPGLLTHTTNRSSSAADKDVETHGSGGVANHKPTSTAGFTVGRWRLSPSFAGSGGSFPDGDADSTKRGPMVYLTSLEDPRIADPENLKYSFKMSCRLKSTTRGRWNKLEMLSLVATNLRTGEDSEIPIKSNLAAGVGRENPSFYFSRVMSYD